MINSEELIGTTEYLAVKTSVVITGEYCIMINSE